MIARTSIPFFSETAGKTRWLLQAEIGVALAGERVQEGSASGIEG